MNPPIIINASMLRHMATCARRVWLDSNGDPLLRDAVPPALQQRFNAGITHEQIVHQSTAGDLRTTLVASWEEGLALTRQLMARGARIINAHLEGELQIGDVTVILRGKVDRLVLLPEVDWTLEPDEMIAPLYAPIEIKQYDDLTDADYLQLDCYVWLLEQTQGITPPAQFWLSRDTTGYPQRRIDHVYDENRLLTTLEAIIGVQDYEPPVRLESHCKECPWYSACRQVAQTSRDVQVIPRLHAKTRQHFREAGITTLDQVLAMTLDELQAFRHIGPKTAPEIQAYAQAFLDNQPVWVNTLPGICQQPGVMFDIETYPMPDNRIAVWSIGWQDRDNPPEIVLLVPNLTYGRDGRTRHAVSLPTLTLPDGQMVHLAPDVASVWRVFADAVDSSGCPVYHWTGYDSGVMRMSAPVDVIERLSPRLHDLHASLKQSVKFPTQNNSLKTIARYLGYAYAGYEDPFAALYDYQLWLRDDNIDALMSACAYQRDDVVATALVWRWLVENCGR